jgi:hypothetical protein
MEITNKAPARAITVEVNNQAVTFEVHKANGAEIKATAIAQGVQIQPDFVLSELVGQGQYKPVRDDEEVTLHPHQAFRAVAPDDNS